MEGWLKWLFDTGDEWGGDRSAWASLMFCFSYLGVILQYEHEVLGRRWKKEPLTGKKIREKEIKGRERRGGKRLHTVASPYPVGARRSLSFCGEPGGPRLTNVSSKEKRVWNLSKGCFPCFWYPARLFAFQRRVVREVVLAPKTDAEMRGVEREGNLLVILD